MKRLALMCLVGVLLLTAFAVPRAIYADNGDNDKLSWLTTEEQVFIGKLGEQQMKIEDDIGSIRAVMGKPHFFDTEWQGDLIAQVSKLSECGGFSSVPPSMQDIAKMWEEEVCYRCVKVKWFVGEPRHMELQEAVPWLSTLDELLDQIEPAMASVAVACNQRVEDLVYARKLKEEAEKAEKATNEGSGCFIATAAYGTPEAAEIDVLRQFRDDFLLHYPPGRAFVSIYYEVSPPVADFISEHEVLRTVVREDFVDPVVKVVEMTHGWWGGDTGGDR